MSNIPLTIERGTRAYAVEIDTPKISIITIDYNELDNLKRSLPSFQAQTYPNYELIVIDNGSIDGSPDYVRAHFPDVTVIPAGGNLGFSGANNLGAHHAHGDYLVFINPDTTVAPDWLDGLLAALQDPTVGMATSKILIMSQPDKINTCANDVQYTGYGYLRGWMQDASTMDEPQDVFAVSGAAFMIRKQLFEDLGGFDDNFNPIYVEDTDLSWRAQLAGYRCVYVPSSVVYHDYTMGFGPEKFFRLERNRHQMLLKNYDWRTYALLLPAVLLAEVVAWGYATLRGGAHVRAKLRSYGWLRRNFGAIMRARGAVQRLRRVRDRDLLRRLTHRLAYDQANDGVVGKLAKYTFDPLFFAIRWVCLLVVRW